MSFTAVPVFFFISGYYLSKGNNYENNIKKAIIRVIKITLIATIVYGVLALTPLGGVRDYSKYEGFFIDVVLLNDNPFAIHLWYLNAYLYALVVLYILRNKQEGIDKYIIYVVFMITTLCVILGKYSRLLFNIDISVLLTRNYLGIALPCLLTGRYIALHEKEKVIGIIKSNGLIFVIGFLILSYFEYFFLKFNKVLSGGDLYFATIPLGVSLFCLTLNSKLIFSSSFVKKCAWVLALCGRKYSLSIYIIHYPILVLSIVLLERLYGIQQHLLIYFVVSMLVLFVSLFFSIVYEKCIINKLLFLWQKLKQ